MLMQTTFPISQPHREIVFCLSLRPLCNIELDFKPYFTFEESMSNFKVLVYLLAVKKDITALMKTAMTLLKSTWKDNGTIQKFTN